MRTGRPARKPLSLPWRRGLLTALPVSMTLGMLAGVAPAEAAGARFSPAYPTVYISQGSGGAATDLKMAAQSRLANAGAGGVTISTVGTAATNYNAIGYRASDGYLYGMAGARLTQIAADGSVTDLGAVTGLPSGSYIAGSFGADATADTLFVMTSSSSTIYGIDVTSRSVTSTLPLSQSVSTADFTWAHGYLWGMNTAGGSVRLARIAMDGTVTNISTAGILNASDTGAYGAAWVYGNGNLAFSYNSTGAITQLAVTNPDAASPTARLVSRIAGPSTSTNDGTTTPAIDSDLSLAIAQPGTSGPGDPVSWRVTVSDTGPGGSSGGTFRFPVPSGVTLAGSGLPTGCTLSSGTVQCVTGQLAAGDSDTYDFSATANAALTVPQTSTLTIVGNENDPDVGDDSTTLTFRPSTQDRSSTGAGTSVQSTTVAKPADASVYLLDGSDRVTTESVPGEGSYAVDPATGVITFTPVTGFTGRPTPVGFVIVPPAGDTATGSYAPTVALPAAPVASPLSTSGVGTDPQTTPDVTPEAGRLSLLDDSGTVAQSLTTGAGGYQVEGGHLLFQADRGFSGATTPVRYRVTDAYGQSDSSTYTATVALPQPLAVTDRSSSGLQGQDQHVDLTGQDGTLLDGSGREADAVTVPGKGTYRLAGGDGIRLSFTPEDCFVGEADPVRFEAIDAWGQRSNAASYTATTIGAPTAADLTSTGVGTAPQSVQVSLPCQESVHLLNDDGQEVDSLVRAAEGELTLDPATGELGFTPVFGYSGSPAPARYRVTALDGRSVEATYAPTVTAPALPAPATVTSRGVGDAVQSVQLVAPTGGSVALLDVQGNAVAEVDRPGVGRYVLDRPTGTVCFVPDAGYSGTAVPVDYQVVDAYGQVATGSYTVEVAKPAPPVAHGATTTGSAGELQQRHVDIPSGGTASLLDGSGRTTHQVGFRHQGTYRLDTGTSVLSFAPVTGFTGRADAVTYRVVDAYGQAATARYRAVVKADRSATPVGKPRLHAPRRTVRAAVVPTRCSLSTGRVTACFATAVARVAGRRVQVGSGRTVLHGPAGRDGRSSVAVTLHLTRLGRALADRVGGVRLALTGEVRQAHVGGSRYAAATTRVQAPTVHLRPVYFDYGSATVRPGDRRYLRRTRQLLAGVRAVVCRGYTDSRSSTVFNAKLGKRRADATCAVLVGARSLPVRTVSRGETRPAHPNGTPRGRALNRRAEVVLRY